MKFLWESNAPWAGTGYGGQTRLMLKALMQLGHEPNCFCFYGLHGGKIRYDGYECWPNSDFNEWGNDVLGAHLERSQAEALVTLMDLFVLDPNVLKKLKVPWLAWTPIDSVGIGAPTLERLKICPFPIAMSDFGAEQMREHDVEPFARIWHAVDTEIFTPVEIDEKLETRKLLGLDEDAFVILMVMANKSDRKQYPLHFEAIKRFMDENKDLNVQVFVHTDPTAMMAGWDMKALVPLTGLQDHCFFTNQYDASVVPMDSRFVAKLHQMADVLLNCSAGEGFGIPIIEAQACGTPVVVGNYTAMPELVENGYAVEAVAKGLGSHYGWQFLPDVEELAWRIGCVYRMHTKADSLRGAVAMQMRFDVPHIARQWHDVLEAALGQGDKLTTLAQLPEGSAV